MPQEMQKLFCDQGIRILSKAEQIQTDIATKEACLKYNQTIINHYKAEINKGLTLYTEDTKNLSSSDFAKTEIPHIKSSLAIAQRDLKNHFKRYQYNNNKLVESNKNLAFIKKSSPAVKFAWATINSSYSEVKLTAEVARLEPYVERLHADAVQAENQVAFQEACLEYAENIVIQSDVCQQANSLQKQDLLSSDARTLIADAKVQFNQFEKLSREAQKEIIGLLNRTAQEKTLISDASYDQVFTTTVKLADVATQAHANDKAELGQSLIEFGNKILDCTVAFSKGALKGIGSSVQNNLEMATHPIETLQHLGDAVVNIAHRMHEINQLGTKANPLLHSASTVKDIAQANAATIQSITEKVDKLNAAIQGATKTVSNMPAEAIFEKAGEKAGEFAADCAFVDGALKAASVAAKVVAAETAALMTKAGKELGVFEKLTAAQEATLAQSEKALAQTAEGFEVAITKKAVDKTKNAVRSEVTSASSSSSSTSSRANLGAQKLTTKELTVMAEKLGFSKTNFQSQGEAVFKKGNRYITFDKKGHNGGIWKMADSVENLGSRATRMGTYDKDLKWIGK